MSRNFNSPTTIFIACEGKNTEPLYFERIKEEIEDQEQFAITIYPDNSQNGHKSTPKELVKEAQNRIDDFDKIWVVYDKNGYTKHPEALTIAQKVINKKQVHIAFSSIAFEQWVLLHFERSSHPFAKSEDIINYLIEKEYFKGYSKKDHSDIYPQLRDHLQTALENAAWLRFQMRQKLTEAENQCYQLNPYTDIDKLVRRLLAIEEQYAFAELEEKVTINELIFCCQRDQGTMQVAVYNKGKVAVMSSKVSIKTIPDGPIYNFEADFLTPDKIVTTELNCQEVDSLIIHYQKTKLTLLL